MNHLIKVSAFLSCLTVLGFSQMGNIQFKTMVTLDGQSFDIYEFVEQGRYIYLQMMFNGWPSCKSAVPGLNATWAKYGCEQCDTYKLLVLSVNFSDSKSAFEGWIDTYDCTHPGVAKEEGGSEFNINLDNDNYGGPKYLIKPDKTFKTSPTTSEIDDAGVNVQHVCPTAITHKSKGNINSSISFQKITKSNFTVNVLKEGVYSISFYTANGQLKEIVRETFLSIGTHKINWKSSKLGNGVYFVEMRNGKNVTKQKVILK